jgi:hypothetical protein
MAISSSPFNIVILHYPPYSSGSHGNNEVTQLDYYSTGVDIVFSGHDHIYERTEKMNEEGMYYIVNGLGGKAAGDCNLKPLSPELFNTFCFGNNYGAVKATATVNKLVVAFYSVNAPLQPIDSIVITKP